MSRHYRPLLALAPALLLGACAGTQVKDPPSSPVAVAAAPATTPAATPPQAAGRRVSPYAPAQEDLSKRGDYTRGGLYAPHIKDSAPPEIDDVDAIPEPEVRAEPRSRYGNRSPYAVLGKSYTVRESTGDYVEQGLASYYGNKFHGRRTSNLEVYDMYAFTAAHKTLPLPSFARVTNLANGKSVVVRVNDRGPFHEGRVIDLSYAAAVKLDVHRAGTARVEVRGLSATEAGASIWRASANPPPALPPVATRPSAAAAALPAQLPDGVRIATGKPGVPVKHAASAPAAVAASAIDLLVDALPVGSAAASERPTLLAQAAPAPAAIAPAPATPPAAGPVPTALAASDQDWRFDMRQDGKAMTADQFDAWMKARRARVATGKPGVPDPVAAPARTSVLPVVAADAPQPSPASPPTQPAPTQAVSGAPGVTLQVAAFGARANAERALTMLRGAGIGGARLQDGTSNGQQVWRLRVGPVASASIAAVSTQVIGLGFGQPQVVRE